MIPPKNIRTTLSVFVEAVGKALRFLATKLVERRKRERDERERDERDRERERDERESILKASVCLCSFQSILLDERGAVVVRELG